MTSQEQLALPFATVRARRRGVNMTDDGAIACCHGTAWTVENLTRPDGFPCCEAEARRHERGR